ncbi:hypothetical protein L227DRAFT_611895 [Lentinus tigrinus ALCF2SS1-6]|uniref:DUF6533 domain-containing protein n=1 Tax=Lentinus tigrinus ALCF2SS1-6 TaxID=1328759 RepID=A0A5C2S760_9APHY|nr:hypothetical protein L227DRAFT_611895 [Lentinus tigrinus ALCF2SS1-6]
MNNGTPSWISEVEDPTAVEGMYANTYVSTSMSTLLFYDYILLLPTEVRLIWGAPTNLASVFYLLIRYGFLTQYVFVMVHDLHFTKGTGPHLTVQSCRGLLGFLTVLNILNFAVISAFVATRIFAMYERSWFLGVVMFVLGTLSPSSITQLASWSFGIMPAPWPFPPCISYLDSSSLAVLWTQDLPLAVSVISIAYESLCLGLTAAKTFSVYKAQQRAGLPAVLSSLLLRDGSLYFCVLLILAILNIVSSMINNPLFDAWQVNTDVART